MRIEFVIPEGLRTASPDTRKSILSNLNFLEKVVDGLVTRGLYKLNRTIDYCYARRYSLNKAKELIKLLETEYVKDIIETTETLLVGYLNGAIKVAEESNRHTELEFYEETLKPIIATIEKKAKNLTEPFRTKIKTLPDYYTILEELEKRKRNCAEELLKLKAILSSTRYLLTSRII